MEAFDDLFEDKPITPDTSTTLSELACHLLDQEMKNYRTVYEEKRQRMEQTFSRDYNEDDAPTEELFAFYDAALRAAYPEAHLGYSFYDLDHTLFPEIFSNPTIIRGLFVLCILRRYAMMDSGDFYTTTNLQDLDELRDDHENKDMDFWSHYITPLYWSDALDEKQRKLKEDLETIWSNRKTINHNYDYTIIYNVLYQCMKQSFETQTDLSDKLMSFLSLYTFCVPRDDGLVTNSHYGECSWSNYCEDVDDENCLIKGVTNYLCSCSPSELELAATLLSSVFRFLHLNFLNNLNCLLLNDRQTRHLVYANILDFWKETHKLFDTQLLVNAPQAADRKRTIIKNVCKSYSLRDTNNKILCELMMFKEYDILKELVKLMYLDDTDELPLDDTLINWMKKNSIIEI